MSIGSCNSSSWSSSWSQFESLPIFTFSLMTNEVKFSWPPIIGNWLGYDYLVSEGKSWSIVWDGSSGSRYSCIFFTDSAMPETLQHISYDPVLLCTRKEIVKFDYRFWIKRFKSGQRKLDIKLLHFLTFFMQLINLISVTITELAFQINFRRSVYSQV